MEIYNNWRGTLTTVALLSLGLAQTAIAGPVTCASPDRSATLDSAVSCETGLKNPKAADIAAAFPGGPWSKEGTLKDADGSNGFLTIVLTSGAWGESSFSANWSIDPAFWDNYGEAVISMHVGNGKGDPDWWGWLITPGQTSGVMKYEDFDGKGGGLSNLKLWARGTATAVPGPGTLGLLGLGLIGFARTRRRT